MIQADITSNSWVPWVNPGVIASKVDNAMVINFRYFKKVARHAKAISGFA
jgi:hypothetical protein